jgi:predicted dithiol-disulfide oxidoreductase (DUF899 family)
VNIGIVLAVAIALGLAADEFSSRRRSKERRRHETREERMSLPKVTSREEWLAARKELLAREKELTRLRDAVNADRRRLPMVAVEKDYVFEGREGPATLLELFQGRRQLIVQHFMFGPDWETGCPSCTAATDVIAPGLIEQLAARDTSFALVSRAPIAKLEAYRKEKGWVLPWYSSYGSDFNYDFNVTMDAAVAPVAYNYRDAAELEDLGQTWLLEPEAEAPGYSIFLEAAGRVFHTYSAFARGGEPAVSGYAFLDWTPLGRQEAWEEPKGRADAPRDAVPDFAA